MILFFMYSESVSLHGNEVTVLFTIIFKTYQQSALSSSLDIFVEKMDEKNFYILLDTHNVVEYC